MYPKLVVSCPKEVDFCTALVVATTKIGDIH